MADVEFSPSTGNTKKRKYHHLLLPASTTTHELPSRKKKRNLMEPEREQIFIPCSTPDTLQNIPCSPIGNFSKTSAFQNITHNDMHESNALGLDSMTTQNSIDVSAAFATGWSSDRPTSQTEDNSVLKLSYYHPTEKLVGTDRLQDDHLRTTTKSISPIPVSDDSTDTSQTSSTEKAVPRRSNRLKHLIGYPSEQISIRVGEHYQADIPEYTGQPDNFYNLESSRWLGERIWPIEARNNDTDIELTGKGRPDKLCLCVYPDTMDCIKQHIHEEKARLQSEIGNAFYIWGFDKMGEVVRESWTLHEQHDFNRLFRRKTSLSRESFWKRALRIFPYKKRKTIVTYYFNVFVLANVRRQAKFDYPDIDSDDDKVDESARNYKAPKKSWLR